MKTNNILFKGAIGKLGDIYIRTVRGQTHLVKRPAKRSHFSEKQISIVSKFQAASQYAKRQLELEDVRELYESGITDKKHTAYLVAVTDYMTAPTVHCIDEARYHGTPGDTIIVKASDDFMVTSVKIAIIGNDGTTLEEGEALLNPRKINRWKYKATVANPPVAGTTIKATAFDLPGNATSLEKTIK